MGLAFKALNGVLQDEVFPLKPGMTMGRSGDVPLNDAKVSSLHAKVEQTEKGEWVLVDNNSKNGIYYNGERLARIPLDPGVKFLVADLLFEVISYEALDLGNDTEVAAPLPAPPPPRKAKYWHEVLGALIEGNLDTFHDEVLEVKPLEPALVLDFLRGVQVTSRWTLGFGPRKIGAASLDLPIWEPGAPAVCFEVIPTDDGLLFKTSHPGIVTINGQEVDSKVLHVGDKIQISETVIEVDFVE